MALAPKVSEIPRLKSALRFYQISAYVTGVMLLLLCAEMIVKYGMHYELYAFGDHGLLAFVPWAEGDLREATGVNLSTGILIIHGWLYVVYLFADFRLWSQMRWPFWGFILIALGGVVPFLSFVAEVVVGRKVRAFFATAEAENAVEDAAVGESASASVRDAAGSETTGANQQNQAEGK